MEENRISNIPYMRQYNQYNQDNIQNNTPQVNKYNNFLYDHNMEMNDIDPKLGTTEQINQRKRININMNINRNSNNKPNISSSNNLKKNMPNPSANINKALIYIRNEFSKKDKKIKELEMQVVQLENQINLLLNKKNNNNNNSKNINNNMIYNEENIGDNYAYGRQFSSSFISNEKNKPLNIEGQVRAQNPNEGQRENSVTTYNSIKFQGHSKLEVKAYLKEVKEKVDPPIFKEFIKNIKSLTNSKDKSGIYKNIVVEKVKLLFGEQYKDLFIKFQSIIGINN
jgi:hypothetical protein